MSAFLIITLLLLGKFQIATCSFRGRYLLVQEFWMEGAFQTTGSGT